MGWRQDQITVEGTNSSKKTTFEGMLFQLNYSSKHGIQIIVILHKYKLNLQHNVHSGINLKKKKSIISISKTISNVPNDNLI